MSQDDKPPSRQSRRSEVDGFLRELAVTPRAATPGRRGRLLFAMDATASREPTWDQACHIQARMFSDTAALGGLDIQLCYFRGFEEFRCHPWTGDPEQLLGSMTSVYCQAGHTQIEKVLRHAEDENRGGRIDALVYVGDCVEEDPEPLWRRAGELGLRGLPVFLFHEGGDPAAGRVFREIARLSHGAYCPFDASSPRQLRDLLSAVAVYAAGGQRALADYSRGAGAIVHHLARQIGKD
ncbi:MAG: VWA domain-containing protein [Gammaproteobacteria bacterium]|nr:VWA domain-containing protein [Gammaproteobacteria bacterium]